MEAQNISFMILYSSLWLNHYAQAFVNLTCFQLSHVTDDDVHPLTL